MGHSRRPARDRRHDHENGCRPRHWSHREGRHHADPSRGQRSNAPRPSRHPRRAPAPRNHPRLRPRRNPPRPQPAEGSSYARKITKQDGALDWSQPARTLWNRLRAFTPWPGTFTHLPATPTPQLLKIWRAEIEPARSGPPGEILQADKTGLLIACGTGSLRVLELQREGGRRLATADYLAGHPLPVGTKVSTATAIQ